MYNPCGSLLLLEIFICRDHAKFPDLLDKLVADATAIQTGIAAKIATVDALTEAAVAVSEASKLPSPGDNVRFKHHYLPYAALALADVGIQGAKSLAEMAADSASAAVLSSRPPQTIAEIAANMAGSNAASHLSTTAMPPAARNNIPLRPVTSKGETRK
jgi:hypothetical protein